MITVGASLLGRPSMRWQGGRSRWDALQVVRQLRKYLLLEIVLLHNAALHYEARPFQVVNVL